MNLNLKITTPEGITYENEIDSVTLPTETGEITILPNHIPLVSVLTPGEIIIRGGKPAQGGSAAGGEEYLSVSRGFIEISKNNVTLLADTAEMVEGLVEQKILEAKERAEKLLQEKRNVSDVAFAEAAAALEREMSRLKIYRRRKGAGGKNLTIDQN